MGKEVDFLNRIEQIASSVNIESILFRLNVFGLKFGPLQNHIKFLSKKTHLTCSRTKFE